MAKPTVEQIAKLPKWASGRIADLERSVKELREEIAERDTVAGESNTVCEPYADHPRPLPKDARVRFSMPDESFVDVSLISDAWIDGKKVRAVYVCASGSLTIYPNVSNAITLVPSR